MSANVKSILANANLTETEGKMVLDNLGVAAELLPFFKDKFSSSRMPTAEALETDAQEPDQTTVPSKFRAKFRQVRLTQLRVFNKYIRIAFRSFQVPSGFQRDAVRAADDLR